MCFFSLQFKATELNLSCEMTQMSNAEPMTERQGRGGNKNWFFSLWSACSPWNTVSEDIVPAELKGHKEPKRNTEKKH